MSSLVVTRRFLPQLKAGFVSQWRRPEDVDLWALSDAWAAARARPGTGRSMGLSGKEVEALKELEERTTMEVLHRAKRGCFRKTSHDAVAHDRDTAWG
eukprot:Skav229879  [mRNA]  locus=scaffold247:333394:335004:+ [translate_table: standard]